ncbi:hypothetical protein [Marininema halotolerans]|uniref:Lipoprotein n=1 Tax=Marininema halotolerans TaxID=1155944 RepID=A0A1I6QK93_9BACL|nr:hypothetical protein [Marininema halotolerans]SFS52865.1 hypothetical protein SAMN05444972_103205 [Marininema halotolerans]
MKSIIKYVYTVLILVLISGCYQAKSLDHKKPEKAHQKPEKAHEKREKPHRKLYVKEVEASEAPIKERKTPEEAVIHQVKWKLSNKKVVQAKKQHVLYNVTYGNQGITVVKVPATDTNYFLFSQFPKKDHEKRRYWAINGVYDFSIGEMETDAKGLALPFENFVDGEFLIDDDDKDKVWVFANEKYVITIGKYEIPPLDPEKLNGKPQFLFPLESFSPKDPKRDPILNEGKHYLFTGTKKNPILYYREEGFLIWISGNVSAKAIKKLAASLPKATHLEFPYSK